MADAIQYARLHEENMAASPVSKSTFATKNYQKSYLPPLLPTPPSSSSSKIATIHPTYTKPFQSNYQKPQINISREERREKQLKGECYFCDKPYERGHKCNLRQTQIFLIEIPAFEEEDNDEQGSQEYFEVRDVEPCISVTALSGSHSFQTMRVNGMFGKKSIHILIDSGSTHNFLIWLWLNLWGHL